MCAGPPGAVLLQRLRYTSPFICLAKCTVQYRRRISKLLIKKILTKISWFIVLQYFWFWNGSVNIFHLGTKSANMAKAFGLSAWRFRQTPCEAHLLQQFNTRRSCLWLLHVRFVKLTEVEISGSGHNMSLSSSSYFTPLIFLSVTVLIPNMHSHHLLHLVLLTYFFPVRCALTCRNHKYINKTVIQVSVMQNSLQMYHRLDQI